MLIVLLGAGLWIATSAGLPWLQIATIVVVVGGSGALAMVVKRNRRPNEPVGNDHHG